MKFYIYGLIYLLFNFFIICCIYIYIYICVCVCVWYYMNDSIPFQATVLEDKRMTRKSRPIENY